MKIKDLVTANRSYRRFDSSYEVERNDLEDLIELARGSASGQNLQPLKYFLSNEHRHNEVIFNHLTVWAGHLKNWPGPAEDERPSAYVVILGDKSISTSFEYDCGIASQSIRLGAVEKGFGSCIIASIKRRELAEALRIPDQLEILIAIAIGKPKETVVIDPVEPTGDTKYWRDTENIHHVPKRSLAELIIN